MAKHIHIYLAAPAKVKDAGGIVYWEQRAQKDPKFKQATERAYREYLTKRDKATAAYNALHRKPGDPISAEVKALQREEKQAENAYFKAIEDYDRKTKDAEPKYILKRDASVSGEGTGWRGKKMANGKDVIVPQGTVLYKSGSGYVPWYNKSAKPMQFSSSDLVTEGGAKDASAFASVKEIETELKRRKNMLEAAKRNGMSTTVLQGQVAEAEHDLAQAKKRESAKDAVEGQAFATLAEANKEKTKLEATGKKVKVEQKVIEPGKYHFVVRVVDASAAEEKTAIVKAKKALTMTSKTPPGERNAMETYMDNVAHTPHFSKEVREECAKAAKYLRSIFGTKDSANPDPAGFQRWKSNVAKAHPGAIFRPRSTSPYGTVALSKDNKQVGDWNPKTGNGNVL